MSETTTKRHPVKTVQNAVLYSDGTILLKRVIASYPHVLKEGETVDDKTGTVSKSFSCVGLMPKDTHDEAKKLVIGEINRILKEENKGEKLAAKFKFMKNGDPTDEDDVGKPENAGRWVVSARETKRPIVLSNKKDPKTRKARRLSPDSTADMDMIYGGCVINMLIRPWFQNNKYGKRVNAGLSVVQFVEDGTPFGSGRIRDEDVDNDEHFGAVDEEDATENDEDLL